MNHNLLKAIGKSPFSVDDITILLGLQRSILADLVCNDELPHIGTAKDLSEILETPITTLFKTHINALKERYEELNNQNTSP